MLSCDVGFADSDRVLHCSANLMYADVVSWIAVLCMVMLTAVVVVSSAEIRATVEGAGTWLQPGPQQLDPISLAGSRHLAHQGRRRQRYRELGAMLSLLCAPSLLLEIECQPLNQFVNEVMRWLPMLPTTTTIHPAPVT